ncbi:MAG: response regulator [Desulfovibrionaceae bacterium]|nr:response regulator [Desulfovibrionaceae bacterium]
MNKEDFDCVLMDIQMPEMDGVTAARAIRTSSRFSGKSKIPIIAITAYAMKGDEEKFLGAGMDAYLSKPFDMRDLDLVLRRAVRTPSPWPPGP